MSEINQVFSAPDGQGGVKYFSSKKEAQDFLRLPKVTSALMAVTDNNTQLTEWLIENQETVEIAFETGTIRRVTKSELNTLTKEMKILTEEIANPKLAFINKNAQAIIESFRWPSVRRMTAEEKETAAKNTLVAICDQEDLAVWVIAHKDEILASYAAGIVKRVVTPQATSGLAAYREKMRLEKEALKAAETANAESTASVDEVGTNVEDAA